MKTFFFHHASNNQLSLQSEKINIYHLIGQISSSNTKLLNPILLSTGDKGVLVTDGIIVMSGPLNRSQKNRK